MIVKLGKPMQTGTNRVALVKAVKLAADIDLRTAMGIFKDAEAGKNPTVIVIDGNDTDALIEAGWDITVESSMDTQMMVRFPAHHLDLVRNFITAIGGREV
jgi:hypothetical protein